MGERVGLDESVWVGGKGVREGRKLRIRSGEDVRVPGVRVKTIGGGGTGGEGTVEGRRHGDLRGGR